MKELKHPSVDEITLTGVLYALGDPVRLSIVEAIFRCHEKRCGGFNIPLSKSTLTHHFRTLRDAGIIHVRIDGTQRIITLRTDDLNKRFPGLLSSILKSIGKK
ncbi:MAG TPA: helix-turn-helix transcriptional regulator [Spirochaetota bacterium]